MGASDPRQAALQEGPAYTTYVPRLLPALAAAELGLPTESSMEAFVLRQLASELGKLVP